MMRFMVESWSEFKKLHPQFSLGHLDTERSNPMTAGLGELTKSDPTAAWELLRSVDLKLLSELPAWQSQVGQLGSEVEQTLKRGGRIFLAGCGATGRVYLSLEAIWRFEKKTDQVVAFMAGGDTALIRAIERFEDYPELGAQQLHELGFGANDLLIASTEGGETPFVLGAAKAAAQMGAKSWLTFCNPSEQLSGLERCQQALQDDRIQKISLNLGPQALSGSTRMQASSALMLIAGVALWYGSAAGQWLEKWCLELSQDLRRLDTQAWAQLSCLEAQLIGLGISVAYIAPGEFSICVLTDTTERGPTFSMTPFEHVGDTADKPSLNFMAVEGAKTAQEAFIKILGRKPRTLDWPQLGGRANDDRLNGFILTREHLKKRAISSRLINLSVGDNGFSLELDGHIADAGHGRDELLYRHLLLKMLLNTHSTLLMGRLGRYQSNVMTWVRASNLKLIDRTLRYAALLLTEKNIKVDQNALGERLFSILPSAQLDQPLVITFVKSFAQMSEDVK